MLLSRNPGTMILNVLFAIAIIAILSAISIPRFKMFEKNLQLSSTARNLVSDLRYAQQLTISEQIPHIVHFDNLNNAYQILKIDTSTTTIKVVNLVSGISFSSITGFTNNDVKFNSYGGVSESGTIILTNTEGNIKTINVKPSGYVQLVD